MPILGAKVDVARTVAAMLGVTQSAAAAMGVLAVWTIADGLLDIPQAEQVGVGIATLLVALALGLGSARTLTGQSSRLLAVANVCSLLVSVYWGLVRPPAQGFPVIPVSYAVLSLLGFGLLAISAVRSRRQNARARATDDLRSSPPGTSPSPQPAQGPAELPHDVAVRSDQVVEVHDDVAERPDQVAERPAWA